VGGSCGSRAPSHHKKIQIWRPELKHLALKSKEASKVRKLLGLCFLSFILSSSSSLLIENSVSALEVVLQLWVRLRACSIGFRV